MKKSGARRVEIEQDIDIVEESCWGCEHEACCIIANIFEQLPTVKRVVLNHHGCFRKEWPK